jgi:catechol 2,3-dioxygenase-like lactoylglutathione lyase family enzyme
VTGIAAWAGIIVSDLDRSLRWYCDLLGCEDSERDARWAKIDLPNGTCVELFAGDRRAVGAVFPSYGSDEGPPVLPGYAVEEPEELVTQHELEVVRSLPGWVVVAAPDRLRVVLTTADVGTGRGLLGFRLTSVDVPAQRSFLAVIDPAADVEEGPEVHVTPIVRAGRARDGSVEDPDGTVLLLA